MAIGLPITSMFTPRIYSLVEKTSPDLNERKIQLTNLLVSIGRIQWLVLGLIMTALIFFGKPFIAFWAGEGYEQAYYVCLLLVIPGTIDIIQNIGIEIQRAQNKHKFRAYVYIAMAVVNVGISIFLCSMYGAVGSAIGTAISLVLVQGLVVNIYLHKKCNVNIVVFWKNILRTAPGFVLPSICGIVLNSFVEFNSAAILVSVIAVYTLIYGVSMWFFGMNVEEKDTVKQMLNKAKRLLKRKQ